MKGVREEHGSNPMQYAVTIVISLPIIGRARREFDGHILGVSACCASTPDSSIVLIFRIMFIKQCNKVVKQECLYFTWWGKKYDVCI